MTDSKEPVTGWSIIKDIADVIIGIALVTAAVGSLLAAWVSKGIERPLWLTVALLFLVLSELRDKRIRK